MPDLLQVRWERDKFQNLRRAYSDFGTAGFVNQAEVDKLADRALRFLKMRFPRSSSYSKEHLLDGWDVSILMTPGRRGNDSARGVFEISHKRAGNPKVRMILGMLENGAPSYSYTVRRTAKFRDFLVTQNRSALGRFSGGFTVERLFTTLVPGRRITQPSRRGHQYLRKTQHYIEDVLVPALERSVHNQINRKLSGL